MSTLRCYCPFALTLTATSNCLHCGHVRDTVNSMAILRSWNIQLTLDWNGIEPYDAYLHISEFACCRRVKKYVDVISSRTKKVYVNEQRYQFSHPSLALTHRHTENNHSAIDQEVVKLLLLWNWWRLPQTKMHCSNFHNIRPKTILLKLHLPIMPTH